MDERLIERILLHMQNDSRMQFLPTAEQIATIKWYTFHGCCLSCDFQVELGPKFCVNCSIAMGDDSLRNLSNFSYKKTISRIVKTEAILQNLCVK